MSDNRRFQFCVQVISCANDGQGVVFQAPEGWGNSPADMWPCEELQVIRLGQDKVIKRPAVMVVWRKETTAPAAGAADGDKPTLDA